MGFVVHAQRHELMYMSEKINRVHTVFENTDHGEIRFDGVLKRWLELDVRFYKARGRLFRHFLAYQPASVERLSEPGLSQLHALNVVWRELLTDDDYRWESAIRAKRFQRPMTRMERLKYFFTGRLYLLLVGDA